MSTFAIVLGVAFVAGTLIFTDTLDRSFTALFASTVGDVVVRPGDGDAEAIASSALTVPADVRRPSSPTSLARPGSTATSPPSASTSSPTRAR